MSPLLHQIWVSLPKHGFLRGFDGQLYPEDLEKYSIYCSVYLNSQGKHVSFKHLLLGVKWFDILLIHSLLTPLKDQYDGLLVGIAKKSTFNTNTNALCKPIYSLKKIAYLLFDYLSHIEILSP